MERAYKFLTLALCDDYEVPVLVSPVVNAVTYCGTCRMVFTPLIYLAGRRTYAQHLCVNNGGIYLTPDNTKKYPGGFLGKGTISKCIVFYDNRAPWFQLDRIVNAYCWQCMQTIHSGRLYCVTPLSSPRVQRLAGFCNDCLTGTWQRWGDFVIREGTLLMNAEGGASVGTSLWDMNPQQLRERTEYLGRQIDVAQDEIRNTESAALRRRIESRIDTMTAEMELCNSIMIRLRTREHMRRMDSARIRYIATRGE